MNKTSIAIAAIISLSSVGQVNAENLQNIEYLESVSTVKKKWPRAKFEVQKPGWLRPGQLVHKVTGEEVSGTIFVVFTDIRIDAKDRLKADAKDEIALRAAKLPNDEAYKVEWVQWTPQWPIAMTTVKERYGAPTCGVSSSLERYCSWPQFALTADLIETGSVRTFRTGFTDDEKLEARKKQLGSNVTWLKER